MIRRMRWVGRGIVALVLAVALTSAWVDRADAQQLEDVVYLKDGGIIRGTIIEQRPGESILIRTRDGNQFRFTMDQIDRITKEPVQGVQQPPQQPPQPQPLRQTGRGAKSPGAGALISLLITGGGQIYNEETTKGVIMLVAALGFTAIAVDGIDEYDCDPIESCAPWMLPVGLGGALVMKVWSIIDASAGAKRWNARHGLAGLPVGPALDLRPLRGGRIGVSVLEVSF